MKRVWVTRDEALGGELSSALTKAGLGPVLEPGVGRPLAGGVRAEVERLGVDDWLVIPNAFVAAALPAKLPLCHVAVVGGATRSAVEKRGMRVDLESPEGTGAAVWPTLWANIGKARRVCFP